MLAACPELVMPVANMLAAAVEAGAWNCERGAQDQPTSPRPPRAGLPPPVDHGPGEGPLRVDHAPIRAGRRCRRARLGPLPGGRARRGSRPVRPQHPRPARLPRSHGQGLRGRGGAGVRAGGVQPVAQLGRLPTPAGVLPGDRHPHRGCRRRLRPAGLQRPAPLGLQGNDVGRGTAHPGPAHARSEEGGCTPRRTAPV